MEIRAKLNEPLAWLSKITSKNVLNPYSSGIFIMEWGDAPVLHVSE